MSNRFRLQSSYRSALKFNRAVIGRVKACKHVEERGLAGAVRSDERSDGPCFHRKVHAREGLKTAEALGNTGQFEESHRSLRACSFKVPGSRFKVFARFKVGFEFLSRCYCLYTCNDQPGTLNLEPGTPAA